MMFGAVSQRQSWYLTKLIGDSAIGQTGVSGEITMELSHGLERMSLQQTRPKLDGRDWPA